MNLAEIFWGGVWMSSTTNLVRAVRTRNTAICCPEFVRRCANPSGCVRRASGGLPKQQILTNKHEAYSGPPTNGMKLPSCSANAHRTSSSSSIVSKHILLCRNTVGVHRTSQKIMK